MIALTGTFTSYPYPPVSLPRSHPAYPESILYRRSAFFSQMDLMPIPLGKSPDTLKQEFIRRGGVRTLYMAFGPPSRACDCLAVNDKGNDRSNRFRDPKRIPDANRSEKPAE